jgi:5'-nucleotidase
MITNDDGITAPGFRSLVEAAEPYGDIVIVAPDSPQSGMGHAITISTPLRLDKTDIFPAHAAYQCSGTPVDCVKLAVNKVLHRKPDILLSGINHGGNSSINIIYSGTLSAAVEGAIEGIPSIGFSLLDFNLNADFSASKEVARWAIERVLKYGISQGSLLNINIPKLPLKNLKGYKICRQANAKWKESFDERVDPHKRKYYWLKGEFDNMDTGRDTDEWALKNGYVSVVPVQYDLTAHKEIKKLKKWTV